MGWAADKNPHSMVSDWPLQDPATWNIHQKTMNYLDLIPVVTGKPLPVFPKTAKLPRMSSGSHHVYILFFAAVPMLCHQLWVVATGHNLGKIPTFFFYNLAYVATAIHEARLLRRLMYMYGCLDGDVHDHDGIPNTAVGKVAGELCKGFGLRVAMAVVLTYSPQVSPVVAFGLWPPGRLSYSN